MAKRVADPVREQRLLKLSIAVVLFLAVVSIGFGLWSGSKAITFDGFYNLIDAGMTTVALLITRLIARGEDDRFQYGYWHLEPLLGLVNGIVLATACAYAFLDGLNGLRTGGAAVALGPGAAFAGALAVLHLVMYAFIRRSAADLASDFLRIDAQGWLMGGVLSGALCLSFVIGGVLAGSGAAALAPFVDPVVLMLAAICLAPFPIVTLWAAVRDILQIAPTDLSRSVREVAQATAARHGFAESTSHVSRSGRQMFVEIGLVAPAGTMTKSFAELDAIRGEIAEAMGGLGPGYWLTVDFTADKRWI